jgi:hypothetical protein
MVAGCREYEFTLRAFRSAAWDSIPEADRPGLPNDIFIIE